MRNLSEGQEHGEVAEERPQDVTLARVAMPVSGRSTLTPGMRVLLEQVITALDLPAGDPGITGRAAAVTGILRTAVHDNATDDDCLILAGLIRDQLSITSPVPGDPS